MVKIINKRKYGNLFHYAHFMCDCVLQEIINDVQKNDVVYRIKNLDQTLGNFNEMYEQILGIKSIELTQDEFDKIDDKIITINCHDVKKARSNDFNKFRNYMFTKFGIKSSIYDKNYPEVLLIERGERINLIDDSVLSTINENVTT